LVLILIKIDVMPAILMTLGKIAINLMAGIGIANVFDNWVKPQVPAQYYPEKIGTGLNWWRILWMSVAFLTAFMLMNWLGKTLGIQILKRKI